MLLCSDCRVCLTGGRAQSVLHFTQQQTGEKTTDRERERRERGRVIVRDRKEEGEGGGEGERYTHTHTHTHTEMFNSSFSLHILISTPEPRTSTNQHQCIKYLHLHFTNHVWMLCICLKSHKSIAIVGYLLHIANTAYICKYLCKALFNPG